ncbi:hypothetical protein P8452_27310 [Trifolium repens]|jgi:hypothetical protein|nr:hypothetical protein P8452_27310 [Trifolium repens]
MSPRKTQYGPKKQHVEDNKPDLLQVLSTLYPQKIVKKRRTSLTKSIADYVISDEIPNIESYGNEMLVGFFLDVPNF